MKRLWCGLRTGVANMKMKRKVILTYVILSILPISGLNLFTYQYTKTLLLARERRLAADSIHQAALPVDYQLQIYGALSDYIFNDAAIQNAVTDTYGQQYFKMYKTYADTIVPTFQTYYALHPGLELLTIFTGSDLHPFGDYVQPLSRLQQGALYPQIAGSQHPRWLVSGQEDAPLLCSVRRMAQRRRDDAPNYLYLQLDYQTFFAPLSTITSDSYGLVVLEEDSDPLYTFSSLEEPPNPAVFEGGVPPKAFADRYMVASTTLNGGLWTVYYYRPLSGVVESVTGVLSTTFTILWLVLILLGILAWVFSRVIVSPLEALSRNMQQVRLGDMAVTVHTDRNDEVGILIHSFSDMIDRINHLIKEVYESELQKKEYQLGILRAQINPHFLYNSLSLINSRAIVAGQEEISQMALLISSFYRTALNRGQDITTVENELANTRAYISIQLLLGSDSFGVEYNIDPGVGLCQIPHFILQPIVENAIGHGLQDSPLPRRILAVSAGWQGDRIQLQVSDNGVGMAQPVVEGLLTNQSKGYGLRNVYQRLALSYKNQFEFHIESREGEGTTVTLLLPQTIPGHGSQ